MQLGDSGGDATAKPQDAVETDTSAPLETIDSETWSDAAAAPELPSVFVDCQVIDELQCGDSLQSVSNGGEWGLHESARLVRLSA